MPLRNILIIALTAVIAIACYSVSARNRYANLVAEAMHLIETEALHQVPREDLFKAAMNGMTDQLDEHSIYISGDDFTALDEDMNQQFGGVGMYVDTDPQTDKLVVLAPIPDTPAFEAGILVGDEIIEIAGVSTEGYERGDAVSRMRGPAGTTVDVSIKRDGRQMDFQLERAVIPVPSVSGDWRNADGSWLYHLKDDPEIGYIRLTQFGKKSTEEMRAAVTEMNGKVDGLILDLRNNAGGLLSSAIDICDMFLDEPLPVVRTRGRDRVLLEQHFCTADIAIDPSIPLVILVNRHSASASEIVAGCLQDHGRAIIVGEQTFGKGTVQDLIPMQRGRSVLKLTVASFWRPSDRQIDRTDPEARKTGVWGIQPDPGLEVALSTEMVFENIRQRNLRDLAGLNPEIYDRADNLFTPPEEDTEAENEEPDGADVPDGPMPDDEAENTGDEVEEPQMQFTPDGRYLDLPLEKAREYLKSHLAIAA